MEEEKKKNKISLTTYVLSLIILALIAIIAIIVIINQNNDEDKSKQNTNNSVVESGQQTNVTETPTPTEPEPTDTKTYEEITSELEGIDVLSVTDVEKEDGKYILKGVIYTQYTMTEDEVEKVATEGKMTIEGKTYPVKKSTEDEIEYELLYGVEDPHALYTIRKNEAGTYYLECEAQISDVWKMTDQYRKITLDEDVVCENSYTEEKTTLEEEFKDFESREAVETTNPPCSYTFDFENGKCTEIESSITAI